MKVTKTFILLFVNFFINASSLFATDYYARTDGNWTTSSTWEDASGNVFTTGYPGSASGDNVYIGDYQVDLSSSVTVEDITFTASSSSKNNIRFAANNLVLTIEGLMSYNTTCSTTRYVIERTSTSITGGTILFDGHANGVTIMDMSNLGSGLVQFNCNIEINPASSSNTVYIKNSVELRYRSSQNNNLTITKGNVEFSDMGSPKTYYYIKAYSNCTISVPNSLVCEYINPGGGFSYATLSIGSGAEVTLRKTGNLANAVNLTMASNATLIAYGSWRNTSCSLPTLDASSSIVMKGNNCSLYAPTNSDTLKIPNLTINMNDCIQEVSTDGNISIGNLTLSMGFLKIANQYSTTITGEISYTNGRIMASTGVNSTAGNLKLKSSNNNSLKFARKIISGSWYPYNCLNSLEIDDYTSGTNTYTTTLDTIVYFNDLKLTSGKFNLNNYKCYIYNSSTVDKGVFKGISGNTSYLYLGGSSKNYELKFDNTDNYLNELFILNGNTAVLKSNVRITYNLNLQSTGILNLNGFDFYFSGTASIQNYGKFYGDPSSSIYLEVPSSGNNSYDLNFGSTTATKSLRNLSITSPNAKTGTLSIRSDLNIVGGNNYGILSIGSNCKLYCDTTISSNSYAKLTLQSDINGSAMIDELGGNIYGNLTVQLYLDADRAFRFLGSPVRGATGGHWRDNGNNTSGVGIQITGSGGSSNNFDNSTSNNPSAFYYDETNNGSNTTVGSGATDDPGWTAWTNGNSSLTVGKGYRVLVRGDRSISLSGGTATANNTTIWVRGHYPTYTSSNYIELSTSRTGSNTNAGYNLLGNPFPCPIDWNDLTLSNVNNYYSTFDPHSNSYKSWNGSTGAAGRYISTFQGFFVENTSGYSTGYIRVYENDKYTSGRGGYYFLETVPNQLKLTLFYDSSHYDESYLKLLEHDSLLSSWTDVPKFYNSGFNIALIDKMGNPKNIYGFVKGKAEEIIPIDLTRTTTANFNLNFEGISSFLNEIWLEDKFTGSYKRLYNDTSITLSITQDSTSWKDRFYIHFLETQTQSLKQIKDNIPLLVYPNPAHNFITAKTPLSLFSGPVLYELKTMQGQLAQSGKLEIFSEEVIIQLNNNIAQGQYILTLKTNQSGEYSAKISIQ